SARQTERGQEERSGCERTAESVHEKQGGERHSQAVPPRRAWASMAVMPCERLSGNSSSRKRRASAISTGFRGGAVGAPTRAVTTMVTAWNRGSRAGSE